MPFVKSRHNCQQFWGPDRSTRFPWQMLINDPVTVDRRQPWWNATLWSNWLHGSAQMSHKTIHPPLCSPGLTWLTRGILPSEELTAWSLWQPIQHLHLPGEEGGKETNTTVIPKLELKALVSMPTEVRNLNTLTTRREVSLFSVLKFVFLPAST